MTYTVSIREEQTDSTNILHIECASREDAIALVCALQSKGIKAYILND